MILYFNNTKGEEGNLYIDFHSIRERVENRIPETTLYRLLQKRCCTSIKYRNRDLYPLKELLEIPEIAPDLKVNEKDE
jgi:hypothetical protein